MARSVEKAYGHALFLTGVENKNLKELLSDTETLLTVFESSPELLQFLVNPKIGRNEKEEKLLSMLAGKIHTDILSLFRVILEKNRQDVITGILTSFVREAKEELKIGTVYVTTPSEISSETRKKIEDKILKTTPYESLEMNYLVDASLLGGMVIRVGNRVVDSSIKQKLKSLENSLLKAK